MATGGYFEKFQITVFLQLVIQSPSCVFGHYAWDTVHHEWEIEDLFHKG